MSWPVPPYQDRSASDRAVIEAAVVTPEYRNALMLWLFGKDPSFFFDPHAEVN